MSQAALTPTTSRRCMLTGAVAALAASAVYPHSFQQTKPDAALFDLVAKMTEASTRQDIAGDVLVAAEEAMSAWRKHEPKPAMRECLPYSELEADRRIRLIVESDDPDAVAAAIPDPNADLKMAIAEHESAISAWACRRAIAEGRCGFHEAKTRWTEIGDELDVLRKALALTPATTPDGLTAKARAACLIAGDGLAWSVVDDLLTMAEGA